MSIAEIMSQILHEVTGHPKEQMRDMISAVKQILGDAVNGLDRELSPEESIELLDQLRKEKTGILAWLVEGSMETRAWIESMSDKKRRNYGS